MKRLQALALALALAGCETTPKRVLVPLPVPCRVEMPSKPVWATESLRDDAGMWEQVKALLAERKQRIGYEDALETALAECRRLPDSAGNAAALDVRLAAGAKQPAIGAP